MFSLPPVAGIVLSVILKETIALNADKTALDALAVISNLSSVGLFLLKE